MVSYILVRFNKFYPLEVPNHFWIPNVTADAFVIKNIICCYYCCTRCMYSPRTSDAVCHDLGVGGRAQDDLRASQGLQRLGGVLGLRVYVVSCLLDVAVGRCGQKTTNHRLPLHYRPGIIGEEEVYLRSMLLHTWTHGHTHTRIYTGTDTHIHTHTLTPSSRACSFLLVPRDTATTV